jgi:hypothetical protein
MHDLEAVRVGALCHGMVTVVEIAPGARPPRDPDAFYVWADATGPACGADHPAGHPPEARFPDRSWATAINSAIRLAERSSNPTVYVIRNA